MRIVKCEKIFLSQNEANTWKKFDQILEGLEREIENPDTKKLICKIQNLLFNLYEEVEEEENA